MTRAEVVARWSDAELVARIRQHASASGCASCDEVKLVARELTDRMARVAARCRALEAEHAR